MAIAVSDVPKIPYSAACEWSGAEDEATAYDAASATTIAIINGPVDRIPWTIPVNTSDAYPHFAAAEISFTGWNL